MQNLQKTALSAPIEIDQQVTTGNQFHVRKRRILEGVMDCKQYPLPQLWSHLVTDGTARKKAPQPFGRDVGDFCLRIDSLTRYTNSVLVHVSGEHL